MLTITLGVGLAWYLERRVQPAWARRLVARRPRPRRIAGALESAEGKDGIGMLGFTRAPRGIGDAASLSGTAVTARASHAGVGVDAGRA